MTRWRAAVKAQIGAFALDVDVRGPDGVLALIGPNGSGKTTLLRTLAGAVTTQHAEIEFGQHVVASTSRDVDVAIEHRRVGYVPQGYGLFGHLDVLDNVSFGLCTGPASIPRAQRRERAQAMLKTLGSEQLSERGVLGLSGGEQQRVALARALIIEPSIVLLDEPLAALDPATRRSVRQTLVEQLDHLGCPSVVVTHDVRDVAALAQHVCVMEHGRVVRSASLDELRAEPQTEFVREFVDAR